MPERSREIHAGDHIRMRLILTTGYHRSKRTAGLAKIVHMQQLPQQSASALASKLRAFDSLLHKEVVHGLQHMAVNRVV